MTRRKKSAAPEKAGYHHGNLRAALVEAGLHHLESAEHVELSLRELARRVGVSANAAYRHFADKDALLIALAAEGFRRLTAAQIQGANTQTDATAALRAAGQAYIGFARTNPALFRLMFGRFSSANRNEELMLAGLTSFNTLLAQVGRARQLQSDDARVINGGVYAWGLVHGLSQLAIDGQFAHLAEDPGPLLENAIQMAAL